MSFSQYKNFGETIKDFQIIYTEAIFLQELLFAIINYIFKQCETQLENFVTA